MAKFARIFEIDEYTQVLIMVEFNSNTDKYDISILTEVGGLQGKLEFEYDHEEQAYEDLNNFTTEKAHIFVDQVRSQMITNKE
ncbi:hypothetical protein Q2490_16795 [Myroides odoratimimus]|uniref:hypothetical protein n=1 Tax=Myroides odoratimimus TaxID=76832 RepID=UPI0026DFE8F1|nr:hypothetical protein [Myroides odoratimimus]MDO5858936.1 hypothetical protein [Myroides odoratimimus]